MPSEDDNDQPTTDDRAVRPLPDLTHQLRRLSEGATPRPAQSTEKKGKGN